MLEGDNRVRGCCGAAVRWTFSAVRFSGSGSGCGCCSCNIAATVACLLQNPVLNASSIAADGTQLEDKQHADGNDDANRETETKNAQNQRTETEMNGGEFVLAIVDVPKTRNRQIQSNCGDLNNAHARFDIPRSIDATIERTAQYDRRLGTASNSERQETGEVRMILPSDARIDPRTMVIHFHYAPSAFATMMRPRRLESLARPALLQFADGRFVLQSKRTFFFNRTEIGVRINPFYTLPLVARPTSGNPDRTMWHIRNLQMPSATSK